MTIWIIIGIVVALLLLSLLLRVDLVEAGYAILESLGELDI